MRRVFGRVLALTGALALLVLAWWRAVSAAPPAELDGRVAQAVGPAWPLVLANAAVLLLGVSWVVLMRRRR